MRIARYSLALILVVATVLAAAQSQKSPPLTNPDVVRMTRSKLSDSTVVKAIEVNRTAFDVSANALIALKDAGVSQTVIEAMLSATTPKGTGTGGQDSAQPATTCSDVPVLKHGRQPELPPCPDASPSSSTSTGSLPPNVTPTASPDSTQPLIERAREAAFEYSEKLPNFMCEEFMKRFDQRGRAETAVDVVSAEIINHDKLESYRNVKIDGSPTDKDLQEIGGSWSTGEFASTLLELFDPRTDASFRLVGPATISGFSAQLYDFQVRSENSHWIIQSESQTITPAYGGSVWVDSKTARVLRIEMQARKMPSDFPMDTAESAIDYSYVVIGSGSFLLPIHAESLGCQRGTNFCNHNVIDFRNYHELEVDFKLLSPGP